MEVKFRTATALSEIVEIRFGKDGVVRVLDRDGYSLSYGVNELVNIKEER